MITHNRGDTETEEHAAVIEGIKVMTKRNNTKGTKGFGTV